MLVNSSAQMHITKAVLSNMVTQKSGHIVNIGSAAGMLSNPGMAVYGGSKAAINEGSDSLRLDLRESAPEIRVSTVTPFYISNGMFDGVRSPVIPILRSLPTARKIIRAIERDQIILRMPRLIYFLPLLRGLLPTRLFDLVVGPWLGIYKTMRRFKGR